MHTSHSTPLRIALIGAGIMGRQHVGTMKRVPDVELVAVVDPSLAAWLTKKASPPSPTPGRCSPW
ncbi:hypothetical protein [Thauera humireducens]|uniref:hypothetical protein n=1 Tax=Thauera humireducens TaxID=1134435 RepID=UPI00311D51E4